MFILLNTLWMYLEKRVVEIMPCCELLRIGIRMTISGTELKYQESILSD